MELGYLDKLRPAFLGKTDAELELLCSMSLQLQKRTGLEAHEHRKRGMERLFPSRVWHEWRDQRIRSVQECLDKGIQELMWIGSSNSNKSSDMADIALSLWLSRPEATSIYVASPYETATETGVWAMILEQFKEAQDSAGKIPGRIKYSDNSIVYNERTPRSFIRVATVDQVGKLVGKKSRDFTVGLLIIILDELPAFTAAAAKALMRVMPNLLSVPNLLVIGAGNFANIWDALGTFCDPNEKDIPGGWDGFDPDRHFRWMTKRGGLCLRFDGLQSPNVKAGKDIYPFLTTLKYIAKLAGAPGGLQSPDAMRFVRSAPVTSLDEFTVTNGERIRAGGAFDAFIWTADPIQTGAFIDPGFGGDPCVFQEFQLGYQKLADGSRRQIVVLNEEPFYIPVRVGAKDAEGKDISVERQIVWGCRERAIARKIPVRNIAYDGSMRSGVVQEFAKWSLEIEPMDSNGGATDRPASASEYHEPLKGQLPKQVLWKEKVDRLLSELWFAAASLIDSQQLRGLQKSPKAQKQFTTRRWNWQGTKKKRVETKAEYKQTLADMGMPVESPNEADAVVGCIEKARRMGLVLAGIVMNGGAIDMLLKLIKEREAIAHFKALSGPRALPAGQLHAITFRSATAPGTLHRRF